MFSLPCRRTCTEPPFFSAGGRHHAPNPWRSGMRQLHPRCKGAGERRRLGGWPEGPQPSFANPPEAADPPAVPSVEEGEGEQEEDLEGEAEEGKHKDPSRLWDLDPRNGALGRPEGPNCPMISYRSVLYPKI